MTNPIKIPDALSSFEGEPRHTIVGLPPPEKLPASYATRHPPKLDLPVEVVFSMEAGDDPETVLDICTLTGDLYTGTLSPEDAELARRHLAECTLCAQRLGTDIMLSAIMSTEEKP